jgi:hypothetical protein
MRGSQRRAEEGWRCGRLGGQIFLLLSQCTLGRYGCMVSDAGVSNSSNGKERHIMTGQRKQPDVRLLAAHRIMSETCVC